MIRLALLVVFGVMSAPAWAQSLSYTPFTVDPSAAQYFQPPPSAGPVDLSRAFINVTEYNLHVLGGANNSPGYGLVSVTDLLAASGGASRADLSATLVGVATRLDRLADRFREGIALAGAINVLPPNPGDRFAVSFGGAGYDGAGAGSFAISARLTDSAIAYAGVARGPTQTLVKGGFGLSFR